MYIYHHETRVQPPAPPAFRAPTRLLVELRVFFFLLNGSGDHPNTFGGAVPGHDGPDHGRRHGRHPGESNQASPVRQAVRFVPSVARGKTGVAVDERGI